MENKPFRCHDIDACTFGQKPCPTPDACGIKPEWKPVSFWQQVKDAFAVFTEPTCCDVNSIDCRQGRDCPVRTGEYKPADAIHHLQEPSK